MNFQKVSLEINGNIGINLKSVSGKLMVTGNIGINSKSVSDISVYFFFGQNMSQIISCDNSVLINIRLA